MRHALAEGYNAIAIPGFIEYLTFDGRRRRHRGVRRRRHARRPRRTPCARRSGRCGSTRTTLGLEGLLPHRHARAHDAARGVPRRPVRQPRHRDPAFWDVYAAGLDELYAAMPYLDGVLIRIGEAGRVYDLPGWDYYSELAVTSVDVGARDAHGVHRAGRARRPRGDLPHVERRRRRRRRHAHERRVVRRGARRHRLARRSSSRRSTRSATSTATCRSTTPSRSATSAASSSSRAAASSRTSARSRTTSACSTRRRCSASSTRTRTSRASGRGRRTAARGAPARSSLELKAGFWQLYELNTELAGAPRARPDADPAAITADWARRWFSDDPATVRAIGEAMAESRAAITDGLYIGPFAEPPVFAIGLEPPPMMWIFEWDILTGDSAVLDVIYEISRDELDEAIAGGDRAPSRRSSACAPRSRRRMPRPGATRRCATTFLDTLDYQASTVRDARRRTARCSCARREWHDTGDPAAYERWDAARRRVRGIRRRARGRLRRRPRTTRPTTSPPRSSACERAERDLPMAWAARVLLVLLAAWLGYGIAAGSGRVALARRPRRPRALGRRPRGRGAPRRSTDGLGRARPGARSWRCPALALALSRGIQTWFLAPAHLLVTLGAWLVFALVLARSCSRQARRRGPCIAAAGGAALLRVVLLLVVLAPTGPGGYWFGFWTDPLARSALHHRRVRRCSSGCSSPAAGRSPPDRRPARDRAPCSRAVGAVLAVFGGLIGLIGLEAALTAWNDQMAPAAVGPLAHPRHHGLPRHPGRHGVVGGDRRAGARRRRRDPGGRRRPRPAQQRTGRRVARLTTTRARAGQRFCPMSQSRSGRPSIASETARAWSSDSEAT